MLFKLLALALYLIGKQVWVLDPTRLFIDLTEIWFLWLLRKVFRRLRLQIEIKWVIQSDMRIKVHKSTPLRPPFLMNQVSFWLPLFRLKLLQLLFFDKVSYDFPLLVCWVLSAIATAHFFTYKFYTDTFATLLRHQFFECFDPGTWWSCIVCRRLWA